MKEIYHLPFNLEEAVRNGIKSPYQFKLEKEGLFKDQKSDSNHYPDYPSSDQMMLSKKPLKIYYTSIKFINFPRRYTVSMPLDENDPNVYVANMELFLNDGRSHPGELYLKSIMPYKQYHNKVENLNPKAILKNKTHINPFTARMMSWNEKERFEEKWGEEILNLRNSDNIFEYIPEILVVRDHIPSFRLRKEASIY